MAIPFIRYATEHRCRVVVKGPNLSGNISGTFPLRQPPHLLFCKKALASIATPPGLEFIPQVKKLLDEGLVRKSLNPCALLVPKIGIIRHQVPKIGGMILLMLLN